MAMRGVTQFHDNRHGTVRITAIRAVHNAPDRQFMTAATRARGPEFHHVARVRCQLRRPVSWIVPLRTSTMIGGTTKPGADVSKVQW